MPKEVRARTGQEGTSWQGRPQLRARLCEALSVVTACTAGKERNRSGCRGQQAGLSGLQWYCGVLPHVAARDGPRMPSLFCPAKLA
jgi:hypothetical protein